MRMLAIAFLVLGAVVVGCGGSDASGIGGGGGGDDGGGGGGGAGCPSFAPTAGSSCSVAGASCDFDCAHGGVATATCKSGKWSVEATALGCPPGSDGPIACGTTTCSGSQYCVQPCCGGAYPQCDEIPASGVCPAGTHEDTACNNTMTGKGCRPDPCTPPAPYCTGDTSKLDYGCTPDPKTRLVTCVCA
ncbi:MAG TPA: hypothetical protein VIF62_18000 [Labilithrix sp.]|jgi:hypothetical protein